MAVAERPTRRRTNATRRSADFWWGDGDSPNKQWPGVTIPLDVQWSSARSRWETTDGRYYFDTDVADLACQFYPTFLRHHIGEFAGDPFTLLPYQVKLLTRPLFGWKHTSGTQAGLRRFRKVFAFLPKGAGKSPWSSGAGIYFARCDNEAAAEVYAVAADKLQARIVHDNAKIMVEQSDDLMEGCQVLRDSIYWQDHHQTYKVISADASTKHGFRPHAVIFDEFHAQKNRNLYEALKRSMVKRRQPCMLIVSHAGDDDEGICFEEYEYSKRVLNGTLEDETCLPVIFEMTPEDDWTDPVVWARVNPGHGITVRAEGIAQECAEAKAEPRKLNDFLRFHGNRWVNQATAWIPIDWWDACLAPLPPDADLKTWPCAAGLDLAQKWDLACFAVVARKWVAGAATAEVVAGELGAVAAKVVPLNYEIAIIPHFWIPEATLRQHEREDGVPYSLWLDAGLVTATEGEIIDYTRIYDDITQKILPRFPLLKQGTIGYDPAFATDIATSLRDRKGLNVLEVLQNYAHLSEPSYIFEALIKGKRVRHGGHAILRNHIGNVSVKLDDARRMKPVKPKNASKRIDGVVASIMATKMLMAVPEPRTRVGVTFI